MGLVYPYAESGRRLEVFLNGGTIEYTEDGLTKIFDYNDHGELILEKDYDENGNVIYYFVGEYEYNEDGIMLSKKTYKKVSA